MIKLHIFTLGDVTATTVSFVGEEEETFTNLLAARALSLNYEILVEDGDSLIPYEDFIYESET